MSDLSDAIKSLKFDKRMKDWNLRQKALKPGEYEEHTSALDDISSLKLESSEKDTSE